MKVIIYNTNLNRYESSPFDLTNQNDLEDFNGWKEELKNNPEYKVIKIEE